jgi:hypothetical protein
MSSSVVLRHQKAARPRAVSIRVALAIGRSLLRGIGGLVVSGKAR